MASKIVKNRKVLGVVHCLINNRCN